MPVLRVVGGLFGLVIWLFLLGLQQVWRFSFGWLFTTLAGLLDDVAIPKPWGGHFRPLHGVAQWLRSLDANMRHALAVAANDAEELAVWLFSRLRHTFALLGREIEGLSRDVLTQFLRLVYVYLPHLVRKLAVLVAHSFVNVWRSFNKLSARLIRYTLHFGKQLAHVLVQDAKRLRGFLKVEKWIAGLVYRLARSLSKRLLALERHFVPKGLRKWFAAIFPIFGIAWLLAQNWKRIGAEILHWSYNMVTDFLRYFGRLAETQSIDGLTRDAQKMVPELVSLLDFWISEFHSERLEPGPTIKPPTT